MKTKRKKEDDLYLGEDIEELFEQDIYSDEGVDLLAEDDQLDDWEAAFMKGYKKAS
jgi:hypothetical protein